MAWYNSPTTRRPPSGGEEIFEANTLSIDAARALASKLGLDLQVSRDGTVITVPNYVAANSGDTMNFIDYWTSSVKSDPRVEGERKKRYQQYDNMDRLMGETIIMLDTYADEVLSTGFILDPVEISISDKEAGPRVMAILRRNKVLERLRSIVRNLSKWGDLGFQIRFGDRLGPFETSPKAGGINTKKTIVKDSFYEPENMAIDIHTPDVWEIKMDEQLKIPLMYTYDQQVGYIAKDTNVTPLSFVQFSLPDEELFPYGRSVLDPLRTIFDQLSTIEALLAISRASRVERLIIKVPTTIDNPTAALAQLQTMRGQWKNMIFTDSVSGKRAYPRTPSLTDVLFIPAMEGFDISPLKPSIDIASVADVEFFRDKAITMTGLPKGYFLADSSSPWGGGALAAQDLKFARRIIPIQDSLCQGLTKLVMVVCAYLGYDVRNLEIRTKIKRPIQISDPILASYINISKSVRSVLEDFSVFSPRDETGNLINPPTHKMYLDLIRSFGMSEDVVKILEQKPNFVYGEINLSRSVYPLVDASTYTSRQVLDAAGPSFSNSLTNLYENIRGS